MPVTIANSATTIKYCIITAEVKKKSLIKEKKHDKIYVMAFIYFQIPASSIRIKKLLKIVYI